MIEFQHPGEEGEQDMLPEYTLPAKDFAKCSTCIILIHFIPQQICVVGTPSDR